MTRTALVYGIALAGDAVAAQLAARGWTLVVADDKPTDDKRRMAAAVGATLVESPDATLLERLVAECDIVCPAPGVPETHPVIDAAVRLLRPIRTEIDLAYEWE
jgi:UDP-N-acetylmuramoylalanine--D-glutamate ligase